MKRGIYRITWLLCSFSILISCTRYSVDELLSARERIEIDGREYVLDAGLNRDFFPPCPPNGGPLTCIIYVIATDSLPFPSSLDADVAWVIKDSDVSGAELEDFEMPPLYEYILEKRTAEYGPRWGPLIYVDVVVRIADDYDSTYLLKKSDVWIHRSE